MTAGETVNREPRGQVHDWLLDQSSLGLAAFVRCTRLHLGIATDFHIFSPRNPLAPIETGDELCARNPALHKDCSSCIVNS